MNIKIIQGDKEKVLGIHYEFDLDSAPIGKGGMGIVYRGLRIDEKTRIKTEVAIKALYDDLPDEIYARAQREASIQIKHINLIEMYGLISESEIDQFGIRRTHCYVISELLHGVDLFDLLKGKFINSDGSENAFAQTLYSKYSNNRKEAAIEIIRSISSGVLALHDAGYIHRDIDPSNIMVTNEGAIKLIDFGIAKNINALDSGDRLITSAGVCMGKAEYASPELVLGDVKNHDFTTDIYALGILLFRLIVGKLPFSGTQYEVQQMQLKSKIPIRLIEDVGLAKVVKKATEKSQSSRYATIAEFRVAIDDAARSDHKRTPYWVYGFAAVAIMIIAVVSWIFMSKSTTDIDPIAQYSVRDRFNSSLLLLNDSNPDSIRTGFAMMEQLATVENYDSAKIELGITYFPYLKGDNMSDTLSNLILRRRNYLNLGSDNDADSVIKYLRQPTNLPPEALYLLGCVYFEREKDERKALSMFLQSKEALEKNVEVGHGYDGNSLKEILIANISTLQSSK